MARRPKTAPTTNVGRIQGLLRALTLDERSEALAGIALTLAQFLDDGAGMATAATARELRATVEALTDDGDDEVDDVLDGLSTPLRDVSKSRTGNARP